MAFCISHRPLSKPTDTTTTFKEYSSKDVVISYEELERRLNQFLEKDTYDKKI